MQKLVLGMLGLMLVSWGFFAHRHINHYAVLHLQGELATYFKSHIRYLAEHAVDADKRKHKVKVEPPRHFIDLDRYEESFPVDTLPRKWTEAVAKFSKDTLLEYGILPWHLQKQYAQLVKAFEQKDEGRILKLAADLGHYVADAHVPLHTTVNYNGQLTGQKGIHGLWESRVPEMEFEDYQLISEKAEYCADIDSLIWKVIEESFTLKEIVLKMERETSARFYPDRRLGFDGGGEKRKRIDYSKEYVRAYSKSMEGMVEKRMRSSAQRIAVFWYSAWVDAGQPSL